jgi:hypothetical protein
LWLISCFLEDPEKNVRSAVVDDWDRVKTSGKCSRTGPPGAVSTSTEFPRANTAEIFHSDV